MRTRARGFTLLEVVIALTLLVTVLAASWTLLGSAQRNEHVLWDEFTANELAISQLERVCARRTLETTPVNGQVLNVEPGESQLPELKMTLFVANAPNTALLADVRVVVAWQDSSTHTPRSLERSTRRRVLP